MKDIAFTIFLSFSLFPVFSQNGLYITGNSGLFISSNDTLFVNGNIQNIDCDPVGKFRNGGTIQLAGNFLNNDSISFEKLSPSGLPSSIIFSKGAVQNISGTASIIFYKMIVNKGNGHVRLLKDISVRDTLSLFQKGRINLYGKNLSMIYPAGFSPILHNPFISGESNERFIYGDSGYVKINTLKDSFKPNNLANAGLTVKDITNDIIAIERGHSRQMLAGDGGIKRFFNVSSQVPLTDSLFFQYNDSAEYSMLSILRNNFSLYASPGNDIDYFRLGSIHDIQSDRLKSSHSEFNSQPPLHPGNYRLTLSDRNCSDPPVSLAGLDTVYLCPGDSLELNAGNTVAIPNTTLSWEWSTGETSQKIFVNNSDCGQSITVKIRDVRGCMGFDTIFIAPLSPQPVASFTHTNPCLGDSARFFNTTMLNGNFTSFWNFGDGTDSVMTDSSFTKIYSSPGIHYVQLTTVSSYGCVDTFWDSLTVFPSPTVQFTSYFNCSNRKMEFTDLSATSPGNIQSWKWNFGETAADTSTFQNPIKEYLLPGNYLVSLTAKTFQGCTDSTVSTVIVPAINQAAFISENICAGDTVNFINQSLCSSGNCTYAWSFGDGTATSLPGPSKSFSAPGVYNISLKILSPDACSDSISVPLFVNPRPVTVFSASMPEICENNYISFINQSSVTTGNFSNIWTFGNNDSSLTFHSSEYFPDPGNYPVVLKTISDSGCISSSTQTIIVHPKPTVAAFASNSCSGDPVTFGTVTSGTNLVYSWNFGDGQHSAVSFPVHIFSSPGLYSYSLHVTDPQGCSDTTSGTVSIFALPSTGLSGQVATCGNSLVLDAGNPGSVFLWTPGNISSQQINITQSGNYIVQITDTNGCSNTEGINVTLNSLVLPDLGPDTVFCGAGLLSTGLPGMHQWNDGSILPVLPVTSTGMYSVTVTDQNNCTGSDSVFVVVRMLPSVSAGTDIASCAPVFPVTLSAISSSDRFMWNTGDTIAIISVNQSGEYIVTVYDSSGCFISDTVNVTELLTPELNLAQDTSACDDLILNALNPGCSYLWSDGSTGQFLQVTTNGNYSVQVIHPGTQCVSSDSITVTINDPLTVNLGNDTSVCGNSPFTLDAGPATGYAWSTGDTTQTIITGSSGTYGVTVYSGGCSAIDFITITMIQPPVADAGPHLSYICGNNPVYLSGSGNGTFNWTGPNGLHSGQQVIQASAPGMYYLQVTDNGCQDTDSILMITDPSINAYFLASTNDTVNKPVQFVDLSTPVPVSYQWDFGDGFGSTLSNPVHTFFQPMTFNVTLEVSNGNCTDRITKTINVVSRKPDLISFNPFESLELQDISLFPNPMNDHFTINVKLSADAGLKMEIFDLRGNRVYSEDAGKSSSFKRTINTGHLPNGIYIARIIAESGKGNLNISRKIVKVR